MDLLRVLRQGQRQGKLVAPQTRHLIAQAGLAQQRLPDPLEQLIALLMAKQIIHLFKIIQIQQTDGDFIFPVRLIEQTAHLVLEIATIMQTGQTIKIGSLL